MLNITNKKHRRKRGEMLIETIIAIGVFSLVMMAVSAMVAVSYHMLQSSGEEYERALRQSANVETLKDVGAPQYGLAFLRYSFDDADGTAVSEKVQVYPDSAFAFFALPKG